MQYGGCEIHFVETPPSHSTLAISHTNASNDSDVTAFYRKLPSHVWHIIKHNVMIICGDMITLIEKNR